MSFRISGQISAVSSSVVGLAISADEGEGTSINDSRISSQ